MRWCRRWVCGAPSAIRAAQSRRRRIVACESDLGQPRAAARHRSAQQAGWLCHRSDRGAKGGIRRLLLLRVAAYAVTNDVHTARLLGGGLHTHWQASGSACGSACARTVARATGVRHDAVQDFRKAAADVRTGTRTCLSQARACHFCALHAFLSAAQRCAWWSIDGNGSRCSIRILYFQRAGKESSHDRATAATAAATVSVTRCCFAWQLFVLRSPPHSAYCAFHADPGLGHPRPQLLTDSSRGRASTAVVVKCRCFPTHYTSLLAQGHGKQLLCLTPHSNATAPANEPPSATAAGPSPRCPRTAPRPHAPPLHA